MSNTPSVDAQILAKAKAWLNPAFDEETRKIVEELLSTNSPELVESFYTDLDFGTGGLRGIMGVGTNRINRYTLGMATQGLCNYLNKLFPGKALSIAIAHDSRNNSKAFARQVAEVIAANGIRAYLFEDLRPTPELSFAIRYLGCDSGIVLTASHNPKEYNGYKVYWNDGAQLVPPHDSAVIKEVRMVDVEAIKFEFDEKNIVYIGKEIDEAYLNEVNKLSLSNNGKEDLKIVFTPLHGTSVTLLPEALQASGFKHVKLVEEQATPDGNFPTVQSPNPEEAAALDMAVKLAEETHADLVIGCDPDADRVGLAVRDLNGKMVLLNGNQTGAVLIDYVLRQQRQNGTLPPNGFIAETVVTTDLIEQIGNAYGTAVKKCLTGFKWIAELIREAEGKETYVAGGEESYGYLVGDFVRDKDAIGAAVLLAEAAAEAKSRGSSFYEELVQLYIKHGYYLERLIALTRKGKSGLEEIRQMIENLRAKPPVTLGGSEVVELLDYKTGKRTDLKSGSITPIGLPSSNFIQFITAAGDKVTARPSGTEPKIKFYFSVREDLDSIADFAQLTKKLNTKIDQMVRELGLG
jgi:phosphoglucomutase